MEKDKNIVNNNEKDAENSTLEKSDNSKVEVEIKSSDNNNSESESEKTAEDDAKKSPEQVVNEYEEKISELEDRHLRLAAEFDNFKKRTARLYEEMRLNSKVAIINRILEVIDNFERALEVASNSGNHDALRTGAEMIYQQMNDVLAKEGVEPIPSVGKKFDPNLHEAVMQAESGKYAEGVISEEMTKGYKMNERVIRYSKVIVSSGKPGKNKKEKK